MMSEAISLQILSSIRILKFMYVQYICAYIYMHAYIQRIYIFSFGVGINYYRNQISYVVLTNLNKSRLLHSLVCDVIILVISPGRRQQQIIRNKTSKPVYLCLCCLHNLLVAANVTVWWVLHLLGGSGVFQRSQTFYCSHFSTFFVRFSFSYYGQVQSRFLVGK